VIIGHRPATEDPINWLHTILAIFIQCILGCTFIIGRLIRSHRRILISEFIAPSKFEDPLHTAVLQSITHTFNQLYPRTFAFSLDGLDGEGEVIRLATNNGQCMTQSIPSSLVGVTGSRELVKGLASRRMRQRRLQGPHNKGRHMHCPWCFEADKVFKHCKEGHRIHLTSAIIVRHKTDFGCPSVPMPIHAHMRTPRHSVLI
jgi:hypothetical protein